MSAFIFCLLLAFSSLAQARTSPAFEGVLQNASKYGSSLRMQSWYSCGYRDWSGGYRDCGSVDDVPVKLDSSWKYSVRRMSTGLGTNPKGTYQLGLTVITPKGQSVSTGNLNDSFETPITSLLFVTFEPSSIRLVLKDGSDAKDWIRRNAYYNSVTFGVKFSFVLPNGKELPVRENLMLFYPRSAQDIITFSPLMSTDRDMAAALTNPPKGPYQLQAKITVEDDQSRVIATTSIRGLPGPSFLKGFPSTLRMNVP